MAKERLRQRWGSADYRRAGALRPTFVRVVNEDLTEPASQIVAPVRLIYGERDTETPLSIATKFESLIPNSRLTIVPGVGHLDVLTAGRFQVQVIIKEFVEELSTK
jgi:pimeloyl-ACP methyl ester carboxylesterase